MASRNSTRQGASANARRTASRLRRGSATPTRTKPPRRTASTRTRTPKRGTATKRSKATPAARSSRPAAWRTSLIVLGALLLVAWAFYPALRIQYQESRERARLEVELESLKERNETLSAQVERLKTPEGVEEIARENLGMVKQGENLYVVLDPETTSSAGPVADGGEGSGTIWVELLDLVFGAR